MKNLLKKLLLGDLKAGDHAIKYGIASGIKMHIDPATKAQRILGLDERELFEAFTSHSQNSEIFVDIGASDGYYGLVYKKINPKGKVFMFDGGEVFLKEQLHNFQLNHMTIEGQEAKLVGSNTKNGFITIDDYLKEKSAGSCFIKIDVEGAELDVLKGAIATLKDRSCNIIIETHSASLEKECMQFLTHLDYTVNIIDNAWWRIIIPEARSIDHNRWLSANK